MTGHDNSNLSVLFSAYYSEAHYTISF